MGLFGKIKGKAEQVVAGKIIAVVLKRAAEGGFGAVVQKLYLALVGKKTLIAAGLGALAAGLQVAEASGQFPGAGAVAKAVAYLAAALATLGQIDGALRLDPPK